MNIVYFCLGYAFCVAVSVCAFIICLRAWHLHKVVKVDPVNVVKTPKKVTALTAELRQQRINEIMERG